jgi:rubrerythrin
MRQVLLIDAVRGQLTELAQFLTAAGWAVKVAREPQEAHSTPADAIILATDAAGLGQALNDVQAVRRVSGTPVVLVVDLDRSGWDRTFGTAGGLDVDALFDCPVDAPALVKRLEGIMTAREVARQPDAADMSAILGQAIANEDAAAAFYRQAAGRASDAATRDALEDLMHDEHEHKGLIEEFRSGARPLPEGAAPGGSLVESFGAPEFSPDMSPADAFLLAAQKEKLAVEFYENWAKLYPQGAERDLLLRLAAIERRHKARVEAMFSNAAFPESW